MGKLISIAFILILFATTNNSMAQKPTIYYVFDPLCGWCYGFTPVMIDFREKHKNKFYFRIISGGMVVGSRVHRITHMASYISLAHKRVEELTGVKFGDEFLNKTLYDSTVVLDSELPTRALMVFLEIHPEKGYEFAHDIQKALYFEGKNLSDKNTYGELAKGYGIDPHYFIQQLNKEEYRHKAYQQFDKSNQLGVRGFPTIILEQHDETTLISSGYLSLPELEQRLKLHTVSGNPRDNS